jgi:hypothetical protein
MPLIKNKTLLDDYKAHMSVALVENRDFIDYSMFDVDGLEEVSHRFLILFSDIVEKCFNLEILITLTNKFPQQWVL